MKDQIEAHDIGALVRPDAVHSEVYTSQAIFDLEMERIFQHAWVYVGHESQIPKAGDYYTTIIGNNPVVMVRDKAGNVNVLYNRCPHKSAKVVAEGCGNAGPLFRCPYHAWTFQLDGSLQGVPHRSWYEGTNFDPSSKEFSMTPVGRVESHRGFVFCSLSEEGPSLSTYLSGALSTIDNFVDRAPGGQVEVAGGVQRVWQNSNWKIFLENMIDTAHAAPTHESSYTAARQTVESRFNGVTPFQLHVIEGNGEPASFWEALDIRCFDHGHSYFEAIFHAPVDEISAEYREQLVAAYGPERAEQILSVDRHNTVLFPSCAPHVGFQQLRVIRPIAPNRTLIEFFTFRLAGTSERFFQRTINYTNIVNSPSSLVMVDDVELYRRCQEGMTSEGGGWISQHRYAGKDVAVEGGFNGRGVSELPMRNMFRAWKNYMAGTN